jgi:hypothetical protein
MLGRPGAVHAVRVFVRAKVPAALPLQYLLLQTSAHASCLDVLCWDYVVLPSSAHRVSLWSRGGMVVVDMLVVTSAAKHRGSDSARMVGWPQGAMGVLSGFRQLLHAYDHIACFIIFLLTLPPCICHTRTVRFDYEVELRRVRWGTLYLPSSIVRGVFFVLSAKGCWAILHASGSSPVVEGECPCWLTHGPGAPDTFWRSSLTCFLDICTNRVTAWQYPPRVAHVRCNAVD